MILFPGGKFASVIPWSDKSLTLLFSDTAKSPKHARMFRLDIYVQTLNTNAETDVQ